MKYDKVYLNPDIDYVFCYLKETIIEEKDCDYYEHNLECDKNRDFFGRTHTKGSMAGYRVRGISESILNSCNYCLEKDKAKCYALPPEAVDLFNKQDESKIKKFIKKIF